MTSDWFSSSFAPKFPEHPTDCACTYGCRYMPPAEARQVLETLPVVLLSLLGEDAHLIIYYGWACNLHNDLLYRPMRELAKWLNRFISDSISQNIIQPGRSDVWFEVPDERLIVLFCHEGDLHIGGQDQALVADFMTREPFSQLIVQST